MVSKNIPKIFTIGASGYIGRSLYQKSINMLSGYGTSTVGGNGLLALHLSKPLDFDYSIISAGDFVLLAAAISAPDICSNDRSHAFSVNVTGTSQFISKVLERKGRIIFFSSDTVYGESDKPFCESFIGKPAGDYAEMKAAVEKSFLGSSLFKSIRLSYVFSRDDKFTKYLLSCAEKDEEAELFDPFHRSIIYRDDVIDAVIALTQKWDYFPQQLINFGGPKLLSRVNFADCLKNYALPGLRFHVRNPGDDFFKNRPRSIAMLSDVLPILLGRPLKTLEEAIRIEFK